MSPSPIVARVFDAIGLFDETFDACEDVEFNQRIAQAGLTCWFTPRVAVRYFPRSSLTGLFRQIVRYGRGRVRLLRKHPETFAVPGLLPAAFLLGVFSGPLLALAWPVLWWVYGGALGLYGLIVFLFSAAISVRERSPRMFPLLPAVFATVHAGAGMGHPGGSDRRCSDARREIQSPSSFVFRTDDL